MAAGAGVLFMAGAVVGAVILFSGAYNVSAIPAHSRPVFWLLDQGMRSSVRRHANGIDVPDLNDPQLLKMGAHCYHVNCAQCHGAPGISPDDHAMGLQPVPSSLVQTGREWPPEQIYWVTRNGIRMAGMPAWAYRLDDRTLWAIVAFVHRQLPGLTVPEYRRLIRDVSMASCPRPAGGVREPDPNRGLIAIRQYGCHACHRIPGIVGPDIHVGPALSSFASRAVIAGVLPNTRENLIRWLMDPQSVSPRTMMPDLRVTPEHAADMAAYLETME